MLEVLDVLEELELLDELLPPPDELEELDEPPGFSPVPPQPVSKNAHSAKASDGVETTGFRGILFI